MTMANKKRDAAREAMAARRAAQPKAAAASDDRMSLFRRLALIEAARVSRLLADDKVGAERKVGPSRRKRAKMVVPTDERMAKGDQVEWVNPGEIDSSEQPIGLTRRFKSSHLDRLHRLGRLTWTQWYAGDWYRNQHAKCSFALSIVGGYGVATSAGEPSYGLPRTEAQARARETFMAARRSMPIAYLTMMDRLLLEDDMPKLAGRAHGRSLADVKLALNQLARFLWLTPEEESDDKVA